MTSTSSAFASGTARAMTARRPIRSSSSSPTRTVPTGWTSCARPACSSAGRAAGVRRRRGAPPHLEGPRRASTREESRRTHRDRHGRRPRDRARDRDRPCRRGRTRRRRRHRPRRGRGRGGGSTAPSRSRSTSRRARDTEAMASAALEAFGRIDILAANAGIYPMVLLADIDDAEWDRVQAINVKGALHAIQACLPVMLDAGFGRIVLTSSITGPITGQPGFAHYGASKAAQLGLMRSLALEVATKGITVNAVHAGQRRHRGARRPRRGAQAQHDGHDPDARVRRSVPTSAGRYGSSPRRRPATSPGRRWSSTAARCCPSRRTRCSATTESRKGAEMAVAASPRLEEIKGTVATRGIEFFFAQFVDLYGRPSAKLVPAAHLDDLVAEGAGFAGFAAGEIGQAPSDPDIAAMPDLDSFTPVPWQPNLARFACDITVEGEPWPYCPRTILRNAARAGEGARLRVQARASSSSTSSSAGATTARSRSPTRPTRSRSPATTSAGLTRQLRLPHHGLEVLQRARLGQLRERPRGRERPVRAELHLRRRARQLRPRDLLPLHGAHARRAARDDRDVHAEAVHAPDRQRLPLPHVALARRRERASSTRPTRAGSGSRETAYNFVGGLKAHARAYSGAHRADRQLVQAAQARLDGERRDVVAGLDLVRLQQPHADAADPGARPDRGPHDRRLGEPVPRRRRGARRRASTGSRTGSTPGEPNSENLYALSLRRAAPRAACGRCPRTCSRRSASSSATTSCARRSAAAAARTTSTTTRR